MQEPEARTGVYQCAPKLADAAVSGRAGPHQVDISCTGVASINVLIFSSADRGMTGQCLEDLSEAGKVEFGGGPRPPDPPCERSDPFKANRE